MSPKKTSPTPLLGAHTSIAGGLDKSVERSLAIGANAAQIFVKNNKQWMASDLQPAEIKAFRDAVKAESLAVVGHTGYLINPGGTGENLEKSVKSLVHEIRRAEQLGVPFLVLHPGTNNGKTEEEGLQRICDNLDLAIEQTKDCSCKIALETTSGQGKSLGHKFEHIAWLLDHVAAPKRFGVCIDTAHIFEAGYDIRAKKGYEETFKVFAGLIDLDQVLLFHVNDSKTPLGSRVDRHEHLGQGHIGKDAFGFLMKDARFAAVPKVLETPKSEDLHEDKENLALLKSFL